MPINTGVSGRKVKSEEYFDDSFVYLRALFRERHIKMSFLSLSSEIGRNLAPFLRLPFYNRYVDGVGAEPVFGSGDDLVELFGLGSALQFGLALFLAYP